MGNDRKIYLQFIYGVMMIVRWMKNTRAHTQREIGQMYSIWEYMNKHTCGDA